MEKRKLNPDKAAQWWCELNCYRWPSDMPGVKPVWWDDQDLSLGADLSRFAEFVDPVLDRLKTLAGEKLCLRTWNMDAKYVGSRVMTSADFDGWWKARNRAA